jgi:hypothetical protein
VVESPLSAGVVSDSRPPVVVLEADSLSEPLMLSGWESDADCEAD